MLGRAPQTKDTIPHFIEYMDPDKWDITKWYRVTQNPQEFHGLSTGPSDLGCHSLVSELRLTIT